MSRYWIFGAALSAMLAAAGAARADDNTVTIGMILPMTGPFASTGKQERAAAELYMQSAATRSPARRSCSRSRTTPARRT